MNSGICEKHGIQKFVLTSPKLAAAIAERNFTMKTYFRKLQIESIGKIFEYTVDCEFLEEFHINFDTREIILYDRNKFIMRLNDRLIIRKILVKMEWTCPICLNTILT